MRSTRDSGATSKAKPPEVEPPDMEASDDGEEATGDATTAPTHDPKPEEKPEVREARAKPPTPHVPQPIRDVQRQEAEALLEYLQNLGSQGAFRVQIYRDQPKTVRVNGRDYDTAGHLESVEEAVDESYLRETWGGGVYNLRVMLRNPKGSYQYHTHRTVKIAGDPKVERLPMNATQPAAAAAPTEGGQGQLVKEVMGIVKHQLDQAQRPDAIPPAIQALLDQNREDKRDLLAQMKRRDDELAQLRADMTAAQTRQPPTDPFRDKLLSNMMDGESARVAAIIAKHDSEIRTLRENHEHQIRMLEERHDRAIQRESDGNAREVTALKQSFEREIASINNAHHAATSAANGTASVTKTTLEAENRRLEREIAELREQTKELRAIKDKPLLEQLKDIRALKEAVSDGEEGGGDTAQKIVEAIPAAIAGLGEMITAVRTQGAPQAQAQPGQQARAPQKARPRVVRDPSGQRFMVTGDGNQLVPVKPKPKTIVTDQGQQIEVPQIGAPALAMIISMLEASFGRDEDPRVVAQTAKSQVPMDILAWIRLNHTEQVSGVDLFMRQVAKLSGTSPLSSQSGREWLREVGAALLSE